VPYQRTAEGLEITLPAQHGEEPAIVFRIGVK
jgi:hypothetical protein